MGVSDMSSIFKIVLIGKHHQAAMCVLFQRKPHHKPHTS